jgi:hypothetical protein
MERFMSGCGGNLILNQLKKSFKNIAQDSGGKLFVKFESFWSEISNFTWYLKNF